MKKNDKETPWVKNRGYPHISRKLNLRNPRKLSEKVLSPAFVAQHAFFPLIHSSIKERRFKNVDGKRVHTYIDKDGNYKRTAKDRPLHYATHLDSMIFACYAEKLMEVYEKCLKEVDGLSDCISAYRKIPVPGSDKNKSTIHFANEAFTTIESMAETEDCTVLKFDLEKYFNTIDHKRLKKTIASLLKVDSLSPDFYSVFKAATQFSYILLDDLRVEKKINGLRRSGFDEKNLAKIRKKGIESFFESAKDFRDSVADKKIRIYKYPFRNDEGQPMGIPQGLPISAVLANLYLFNLDEKMFELVKDLKGYYRRYSDDIIIVCKNKDADKIESSLKEALVERKVTLSPTKTERFLFTKATGKLVSAKIIGDEKLDGYPFTYLGFEFNGQKRLIKSANLSKFYRRMIYSVKRKANRALAIASKTNSTEIKIFRRQLYRLYTAYNLDKKKVKTRVKWLNKSAVGEFSYQTRVIDSRHKSNYLSYVARAASIMKEPAIRDQIRNHRKIFNVAINKHLNRVRKLID